MGGTLKGATGMGAPLMAIPIMASQFDVRLAVVIMVIPSIVTNVVQLWQYRRHLLPGGFSRRYAIGGAAGALLGTALLAYLPERALSLGLGTAVVAYIALRLSRPDLKLPFETALKFSVPAGVSAGVLQGASGISAPVSVTYLNAMRLDRATFVASVSVIFMAMASLQVPSLIWFGLLDWHRFWLSCFAVIPLLLFMPVGERIARRISPKVFDRLILVVLALLAARLIWSSL
ncbi:sulfite exporter TauE/SafE family protein [Qingshengfaniella alkalisoli]|uniref:Probable membrane transporter protein n=2 Tax=Qingshengfaniella alkalisoli TaxID=2599296 RepID=A0A5B8I8B5_9RHOB|nr:sulfite exporter TauE/SafE family protein [Qingshengfaniella alkalisoli]